MFTGEGFGSVPMWFFIIAFAFVILFIIYSEWNARR